MEEINIYNCENKKQRIFDAALELFAQKGYECTTTREICKLADVNISLISYYFGGKKELYSALVEELSDRQMRFLEKTLDFNIDFNTLAYEQKVALLSLAVNAMIDFLYRVISKHQVRFFLKVQQEPQDTMDVPIHRFLLRLMASIVDKAPDDKEVVYRLLFLMSQIAFPRLVPRFLLSSLKKDNFDEEDIAIIKRNTEIHIKTVYLKDTSFLESLKN